MSQTNTDPGTPTEDHVRMELARELPRMLDSSRPDGGISRLLADPGGRLHKDSQGRKVAREQTSSQGIKSIDLMNLPGDPRFVGERPLLIQHQAETIFDYRFRAAIAAPRNGFWHSVESVSGRPFRFPMKIDGDAPDTLSDNGEWVRDADLNGNSLRAIACRTARQSTGYGLDYLWVDFSKKKDRPYVRRVDSNSVIRVMHEDDGTKRMHVRMTKSEYENPGDDRNPAKFPIEKTIILVFREGNPNATSEDEIYASYQIFEAIDKDGDKISDQPTQLSIDGNSVDRVSLKPLKEIPLVPVATGQMSSDHFILPPLLEAAQLDYLNLQITSNTEFATVVANTFIRFAKGLTKKDIEDWAKLGNQFFYATTSPDADMKWVTLAADAINAGMELSEYIGRALEVAGLAPMLTRSPGDERATGQAIASARQITVAESFCMQWESAITKVMQLMSLFAVRDPEAQAGKPLRAILNHDIGMDSDAIEHASLLTRLYLDPTKPLPSHAFYAELVRIGVISEDADMASIVKASESAETALERDKLELDREKIRAEKAAMLISMAGKGHFETEESAKVLYKALVDNGLLPEDTDVEMLAKQRQLALDRERNMQLYLSERLEPENFWNSAMADQPIDVSIELENGDDSSPGNDEETDF